MSTASQGTIRLPLWVRVFVFPPAWLLARLPHCCRAGMAGAFGAMLYYGFPRRRRILFSNLRHAYPDWTMQRIRALARKNCTALIEMGLFAICGPFLSREWVRRNLHPTEQLRQFIEAQNKQPRPGIILAPHSALLEAPPSIARLFEIPETGALYRPLNQRGLNAFLEWSRTRSGMTLLSKKAGLAQALKFLRQRKHLAIPFDQNAGPPGAAILFLDRVCSATDLPGSLASRFNADVYILYPIRRKGWKMEIDQIKLEADKTPEAVTLAAHQWLEKMLRSEECPVFREDWMWSHNRWKTIWDVRQCLRPVFKKNYLPADLPRRLPIVVRLPDELPDIEALVTLLQALRRARPDAAFTVAGTTALVDRYMDTLRPLAESVLPIPAGAGKPFWKQQAKQFPEIWISLAEDDRFDREGRLLQAPVRIGTSPGGAPRPLLTACYEPPSDSNWEGLSQAERWLTFAACFGHPTSAGDS